MINLEFIVIHHSCALILNTNDNRRMCESSKKEKLSTYKIPNFFIKFYIGNELKTSKYSNKFIMHIQMMVSYIMTTKALKNMNNLPIYKLRKYTSMKKSNICSTLFLIIRDKTY